jgi:EAL and modified HD-GYP domain-containing signal transduction protein
MDTSDTNSSSPTASPVADRDEANMASIARQAIVDEKRDVYGYELFDRSVAHNAHTAASDAALLFNALSYAGAEALVGKRRFSSTAPMTA